MFCYRFLNTYIAAFDFVLRLVSVKDFLFHFVTLVSATSPVEVLHYIDFFL